MTKKLTINKFVESTTPIKEPITKFGGQPVWLETPAWPVSVSWEMPMQFVCQIDLRPLFKCDEAKLAYIFLTHASFEDKDKFFDPDVIFPDEGENAVIIQPGGVLLVETEELKTGPSLYTADGENCEFVLVVTEAEDPPFITSEDFQELPSAEREKYTDCIYGNKLGGVPYFFQGDEWPDEEQTWNLLLQLNTGHDLPFYLNLGASPQLMAFVSEELTHGRMLVQDS